jgi:hypothetical protein
MRKKLLGLLLITSLTMTTLTGCGSGSGDELESKSKAELIEMYNTLATNYDSLNAQFSDYRALNDGMQSENEVTAAISITGDGTGRFTFNSVDSKIIFPTAFQYPGSTATSGDGQVDIVNNISITPSSNWICKINGSTLELENTSSNISGTIKIGQQNYLYTAEELKTDVLSAWFEGLPQSQVNYTYIYVNNQPYGVQATTPTTIDSEDAYLRCGMLASDNYCITYVFVYRGSQSTDKDESITNLLNSIKILDQGIIVEQN